MVPPQQTQRMAGVQGTRQFLRDRSVPEVAVSPAAEMLAVFPEAPPPDLVRTLDLAGYRWKAVSGADEIARNEPPGGWAGAIVSCDADAEGAWALCRALRKRDLPVAPLLLLVGGGQLGELALRDELFDDFCLTPFHPI